MSLQLIEGHPVSLTCNGCDTSGIGGTETYQSAATGNRCAPGTWYRDTQTGAEYCSGCAVKLTHGDQTRSVTQFYSDTAGTEVRAEYL